MARRPRIKWEAVAAERGYESVEAMLLDLMRKHRAVTGVSIELGCSIQGVSAALDRAGWQTEGRTSDRVWIAPNGERIEVNTRLTKKDPAHHEALKARAGRVRKQRQARKKQAAPAQAADRCAICGRTPEQAAMMRSRGVDCAACRAPCAQGRFADEMPRLAETATPHAPQSERVLVVDFRRNTMQEARIELRGTETSLPKTDAEYQTLAKQYALVLVKEMV